MVNKRGIWGKVMMGLLFVSGGFLSASDSEIRIVAQASSKVLVHEGNNSLSKGSPLKNVTGVKPANSSNTTPAIRSITKKSLKTAASKKPTVSSTSKKKIVYLTFDDGPEAFSPQILSLLQQYHFKATFFMLDGNMKKHSNSVKQMVKNGHSVGMHGVSHDKKKFYQSKDSVLTEMNQAKKTLKSLTGVDSSLIRTPYGSNPGMTVEYRQAILEKGYEMWDWNIDSRDWFFKDKRFVDSIIEQLKSQKHKNEPIVILLHERKDTLAHLPALFNYLKANNYVCQPLNQSMNPLAFAPQKK